MSIEKITSAILDEATTESEQIINAAKVKNRGVIRELEKRIKIETDVAVKAAQEEREKIISRKKSVADIDSKKIILSKKQEIISQCFDQAVEHIMSLDQKQYVAFLAEAGKRAGFKEGSLIFNKKEKDTIGSKVAKAMEEAIPGGKFEVSQETRNLRGGYMLQRGQVFINNSLEALVEEKRQELTGEVAQILFPPEK